MITGSQRWWRGHRYVWLNLTVSLALLAWGLWALAQQITLADLGRALAMAQSSYTLLAFLAILFTLLVKAARWRLLFVPPTDRPPLAAAFWAMMMGQLINTAVSFLRLGDLARIYALFRLCHISKLRSLGTLIIEKTLDLLFLALILTLLLPCVVRHSIGIPDLSPQRATTLGSLALITGLSLYLLAFQTQNITRLLRYLTTWVGRYLPATMSASPAMWPDRLFRWVISGLDGLASLRSPTTLIGATATSTLIALLSILTPWALFPAFGLPYGLKEATMIHVVVTITSSLPVPIPAKLGLFEAAVLFTLHQLGWTDDAIGLSYALLFHLVIVLPQILFGTIAAWQTGSYSITDLRATELTITVPHEHSPLQP